MAERWTILAVLFVARMAMAFQYQSIGALGPLAAERYGLDLADIGFLIGLYLAPGIAIALPGAAIASLAGERRTVVGGLGLMVLGGLLTAFAPNWGILAAGRLVSGAGGVAINVVMAKMTADWFAGREIATAMAILVNSWPVGIGLALILLPPLAALGGTAAAWSGVAALAVVALVLVAMRYRPPAGAAAAAAPSLKGPLPPILPLVYAGAIWALFNAALAMIFGFGPALLAARGWSLTAAASTTSLFLWLAAVSVPLGGFLADRLGRTDAVIAVPAVASALLFLLIPAAPNAAVPILLALLGLVAGLPAGPIMSLPALVLRPQTRATGMGVFFTIYYLAMLFLPLAGGWLGDRTGTPAAAFVFGAAIMIATAAALPPFRRSARAAAA